MRWVFLTLLVVLGVAGMVADARSAHAHGVSDTADLQLAQTFAGNDLTVVIRRTPKVPGPLQVDVIAHRPVVATTLALTVRATTGTETSGDALTHTVITSTDGAYFRHVHPSASRLVGSRSG